MTLCAKLRLILCSLLLTTSASAADVTAARVVDFNHSSAAYHVERHGRPLQVHFNMDLQNGDRVFADVPGATLVVKYDERSRSTVVFGKSVVIEGATEIATSPSNAWNLMWQHTTDNHNRRITTGTKGDDGPLALLLPGLNDGTARIAAGERHFMLGWCGGVGPFHIVVRNAQGPVYDDKNNFRNLIVASHTITFTPGRYDIEITDNDHRTAHGSFTVVVSGISKPNAKKPDAIDRSIGAAAELAAGDDRSLYYEAYLRLFDAINTPDKKGDPLARALALWISDGARAE